MHWSSFLDRAEVQVVAPSAPAVLACPAASLHCHHPARCPPEQYGELVRSSGLPAAQLRAALLVLIQHNYVNCYLKEEPPTLRGPGPSYHVYEAALPRILQSLRWVQWPARTASPERFGCWQSGHRVATGHCTLSQIHPMFFSWLSG